MPEIPQAPPGAEQLLAAARVAREVAPQFNRLIAESDASVVIDASDIFTKLNKADLEPLPDERRNRIEKIKADENGAAKAIVLAQRMLKKAEQVDDRNKPKAVESDIAELVNRAKEKKGDQSFVEDVLIAGFEMIAAREGKKVGLGREKVTNATTTDREGEQLTGVAKLEAELDGHLLTADRRIAALEADQNPNRDEYSALTKQLNNLVNDIGKTTNDPVENERLMDKLDIVRLRLMNQTARVMNQGRGREIDYDATFDSLKEAVKKDTGLDIHHAVGFLQWTRDLMAELIDKNASGAVDFDRMLHIPVGAFSMSFEQLLKLTPKDMEGINQLRVGGGTISSIHDFRIRLGKELASVTSDSIRKVIVVENYGDLGGLAKGMSAIATKEGSTSKTAGDYADVKNFLPLFHLKKDGDFYIKGQEGRALEDQWEWSHAMKESLKQYYVMKRVWQDQLSLAWKKDSNGNIYILGGGFNPNTVDVSKAYLPGEFLQSLQNETFGFRDDSAFKKYPSKEAGLKRFLWAYGYLPEGVSEDQIRIVDKKQFDGIDNVTKSEKDKNGKGIPDAWAIPGLYGREAMYRMGGYYQCGSVGSEVRFREVDRDYHSLFGKIKLADNGKMVFENIFFANPRVSEDRVAFGRERIRLIAGGYPPEKLQEKYADWNGFKETPEFQRYAGRGKVVEYAAHCMMYSGLEVGVFDQDQGDNAPNKLFRFARWGSVQARTGRSAPGDIVQSLARILVPFSEAYRIGDYVPLKDTVDVVPSKPRKLRKLDFPVQTGYSKVMPEPQTFEEWMVKDGEWKDIPFTRANGLDLPDKAYTTSLTMAINLFGMIQEKKPNLAHMAKPLPDGSIERKEEPVEQLLAAWKSIYLTNMVMQISNSQHKILRNADGKYEAMPSFELSKREYEEVLVSWLSRHAPEGWLARKTGFGAVSEAERMNPYDEKAFNEFMETAITRRMWDWRTGEEVGDPVRLFTHYQEAEILKRAGLGDAAFIRRKFFGST